MKYILELQFKDKPECSLCMLSGIKGLDLDGESVICCFALGNRPKCPDVGCLKNCPLKKMKI